MRGNQRRTGLIGRYLALVLCAAALAAAATAPAAQAAFGVESVGGLVAKADGTSELRAGAHPASIKTSIEFSTLLDPLFEVPIPDGNMKTVLAELPPGFVGNPNVLPKCAGADLADGITPSCPISSQIGTVALTIPGPEQQVQPLYNMEALPGYAASFGFNFAGSIVFLNASLRSDGDYGITVGSRNIDSTAQVYAVTTDFWGVPADSDNDDERVCDPDLNLKGCDSPIERKAFLRNPVDCAAGATPTTIRADSWVSPGAFDSATFDTDENGKPMAVERCSEVPFEPRISLTPTERTPATPTGLEVRLRFPQVAFDDPEGLAEADLKRAVVTLPEGFSINPASADGLRACADAELGLGTLSAVRCPDAAKLGSAEATTPVLTERLTGAVYLRPQASDDPQSGEMFRIALVLENEARGVLVKLPGQIRVDPGSGRITTTFANTPQLPVSEFTLRFKSGPRAPLMTPPSCGDYAVQSVLTPWTAPEGANAVLSSSLAIDRGCGSRGFEPRLVAGTENPVAGEYSSFTLRLIRGDGMPNVSTISATLPEGLLAKLAGVPLCGEAEAASGNCAAASQVGTTTVGAGAGSNPLYVPQPGKAPTALYLAGPYKGAPYSLVAKVPAQAGPFDLGTVVVRNALHVDRRSAQVRAVSDPLPQIVKGVPVAYRDVRVEVTRPQFVLNPTSCEPMRVATTIGAATGQSAEPSSRFQVSDCERLPFKPRLSLRLRGSTERSGYPQLTATLTQRPGANIERASVAMPRSEFLAQNHIRTVCTRVQFAADACPAGSVYGTARAFTPLLDKPLEGAVYLRSSDNPLPDLVADLRGPIRIELVGRIDSFKGGIRTTFTSVPDAPVSKFVLEMQGGRKGLLENSRNLCLGRNRATAKMDAHSGKERDWRPLVRAAGCKRARG